MRGAVSRPGAVLRTRRPPYHTMWGRALSRSSLCAPLAAGLLALSLGGCSMQLSSLLPGGVSDAPKPQGPSVIAAAEPQTTGSIPLAMANAGDVPMGMNPIDWPLARAALKEALSRTDDGPSVPWENPASGARGTVTPIASAFDRDGFACRNFLASHVRDGQESWLEGTACRVHRGEWDVKSVKEIRKS